MARSRSETLRCTCPMRVWAGMDVSVMVDSFFLTIATLFLSFGVGWGTHSATFEKPWLNACLPTTISYTRNAGKTRMFSRSLLYLRYVERENSVLEKNTHKTIRSIFEKENYHAHP